MYWSLRRMQQSSSPLWPFWQKTKLHWPQWFGSENQYPGDGFRFRPKRCQKRRVSLQFFQFFQPSMSCPFLKNPAFALSSTTETSKISQNTQSHCISKLASRTISTPSFKYWISTSWFSRRFLSDFLLVRFLWKSENVSSFGSVTYLDGLPFGWEGKGCLFVFELQECNTFTNDFYHCR